MPLPDTVRICGLVYKISYDDILDRKTGCVGMHLPEMLEIRLQSRALSKQKIEQTFIHEIMHAVSIHFMNDKLVEEDVNTLANAVYSVLSDNKFLNMDIFDALSVKKVKGK